MLALLAVSCPPRAAIQSLAFPDPRLAKQLQTELDGWRASAGVVGVSMAVRIPGKGLWVGTSGLADRARGVPMRQWHQFRVAGVTKTFTAAAVLRLAESRVLGLEDPLLSYLPDYPQAELITVRQLLNHSSGIVDAGYSRQLFREIMLDDPRRHWTPQEAIALSRPAFQAGRRWVYANGNYLLLGQVVERAAGAPFASVLEREVIRPLKLEGTFLASGEGVSRRLARGHVDLDGDGSLDDIREHPYTAVATLTGSSGALVSTTPDVARLLLALFEEGFLEAESRRQMVDFLSAGGVEVPGYGLGIAAYTTSAGMAWGHGGTVPGFAALALYWPEDGITVVILTNQSPAPDPRQLVEAVHSLASGQG